MNKNNIFIILLVAMAALALKDNLENPFEFIYNTITALPAIIIGLSLHEFGHAYAAYKLGDDTPMNQNRVTINPFKHIEIMGFICLIFAGFGWGKPVQINPNNFKKARRDELIVSLAGVTMNLIIAIIFYLITVKIYPNIQEQINSEYWSNFFYDVLVNMIIINIVLMIFNLLPIPPLDGFGVITQIFDLRKYDWYYKIYNKGFLILLILIFLNVLDSVLSLSVNGILKIFYSLFGGF